MYVFNYLQSNDFTMTKMTPLDFRNPNIFNSYCLRVFNDYIRSVGT